MHANWQSAEMNKWTLVLMSGRLRATWWCSTQPSWQPSITALTSLMTLLLIDPLCLQHDDVMQLAYCDALLLTTWTRTGPGGIRINDDDDDDDDMKSLSKTCPKPSASFHGPNPTHESTTHTLTHDSISTQMLVKRALFYTLNEFNNQGNTCLFSAHAAPKKQVSWPQLYFYSIA